jgi:hypothetical protein
MWVMLLSAMVRPDLSDAELQGQILRNHLTES